MKTTSVACVLTCLAVFTIDVSTAVAQPAGEPAPQPVPQEEKARALFEAGQASYKVGDFKGAIQAFEQAYVIVPRPALLFSIGQAHRRQYVVDSRAGHVAVAIKAFKDYLAKVETGGRRKDAVEALAELEPVALSLEIDGRLQPLDHEEPETRLVVSSQITTASIRVDGASAQAMPFSSVLTPGKHTVVLSAPGYADEAREIDVAKGGVTALDLAMRSLPAKLTIAGPAGASVSVDGRPQGTLPLEAPLPIEAGPRRVRVTMNGYDEFATVVSFDRGAAASVEAELSPTAQRTASIGLLIGAAGIFATGAALGGVALVRHLEASGLQDDFDAGAVTCRDSVCQPLDDYNAAIRARDSFGIASGVLLGTSVAAGAAGLLLFALDPPGEERVGPVHAAPDAAAEPSVDLSVGPVTSLRVRFH